MHAFSHHQVHTVATKEQAGVKKDARSMRSLRKNDALTLFNELTMDSPFDTKGGIVYSPVDTKEDSTMDSTTGGIVYSPSGQNPYTEAMDKTLQDLPTLSLRSKPNLFASDGVKASIKASRWVELHYFSSLYWLIIATSCAGLQLPLLMALTWPPVRLSASI